MPFPEAIAKTSGIYVGCAGWAIPRAYKAWFPAEGSSLERYAARCTAVEIDSTFYRLPKPQTLEKWAGSVPESFRFAVKLAKSITHIGLLRDTSGLDDFLIRIRYLGTRLGPLLIQLPPRLAFDHEIAARFFETLRTRFAGPLVCEPRHVTWFSEVAERILADFEIARVAADPAPVAGGQEPAAWHGLAYFRLHGSPRRYYSSYPPAYLDDLASQLKARAGTSPTWCIFDNTASGAALGNALDLLMRLQDSPRR